MYSESLQKLDHLKYEGKSYPEHPDAVRIRTVKFLLYRDSPRGSEMIWLDFDQEEV
jgi:hypothetical protein